MRNVDLKETSGVDKHSYVYVCGKVKNIISWFLNVHRVLPQISFRKAIMFPNG